MFQYLEFVCPLLCFVFCVIHSIIECFVAHRQNKKIERLCEKCGLPIYEDIPHTCELTSSQIEKLVEFVSSLRGDNNGS